jgi:hypothetical protein
MFQEVRGRSDNGERKVADDDDRNTRSFARPLSYDFIGAAGQSKSKLKKPNLT